MEPLEKKSLFQGTLIILLLLFLYLSFKIVEPFLKYMVVAFILAFLIKPVYNFFLKFFKNKYVTSVVVIILMLLILIIPTLLFMTKIVKEASNTYINFKENIVNVDYNSIPLIGDIAEKFKLNIGAIIERALKTTKDYFVISTPDVIGDVAQVIVRLFIMFVIIFFALIEGDKWVEGLKSRIPMKREYKDSLFNETKNIISAVIYGQALTSVIQGVLGGIGFFIFEIPNPIFWGFVMMICAFIPFIGTPVIFVPASIIEIAQHNYFAGIGMLIFGFLLITNIDNILKPYFIGARARVHPLVIVVGVIGGLIFFGFIGLILGPLILSLLLLLMKMNYVDTRY